MKKSEFVKVNDILSFLEMKIAASLKDSPEQAAFKSVYEEVVKMSEGKSKFC